MALMEADPESGVLLTCRTAITGAGTALLERAQREGVVRGDTSFTDVVRMVGAIAMVPTQDPEQKKRLLELALLEGALGLGHVVTLIPHLLPAGFVPKLVAKLKIYKTTHFMICPIPL